MGANTKIEWAHHTFNPWYGCTKVSLACDHCYAESWAKRSGLVEWGNAPRRRSSSAKWREPLKWNEAARAAGERHRVFCASLADVFDNQVAPAWRADLFDLIRRKPHLDWLLLTKRPQNIVKMIGESAEPAEGDLKDWLLDWLVGKAPTNVWLGTTAEDQPEAERRVPHLLAVPAKVRFLSCEPLLGPLNLRAIDIRGDFEMDALRPSTEAEIWAGDWSPEATGMPLDECIHDFTEEGFRYPPSEASPHGIDWVICGGESGPGARPMHPDWARSLRDQCNAAGVPFFFKQWGEWLPLGQSLPVYGLIHGSTGLRPGFHKLHYGRRPDTLPSYAYAEAGVRVSSTHDCHSIYHVGKHAAGRTLDGRTWDEFPKVSP